MSIRSSSTIIDRAKEAGCWVLGLYAFALFFAIGMLVTLLNGDILSTLQALIVASLLLSAGIWLARRPKRGR